MAEAFDAYHQWLGIPPQEQPPTHYRLLGLSPFESNQNVIATAAERQMMHVKSYQLGKQNSESQRLLNELATAKLVLLNPHRRGAYDLVLRSATPAASLEASPAEPQPAAAHEKAPAPTVSPGGPLDKYRVLESLPGSVLAPTYKVQHVDSGRYYLLKFVPHESLGNTEVVKRFERECEILTRLDHPNLIVGHETLLQGRMRFLVMEYVLGTDLATLVKQQGPLEVDEAVDYLLQAARGLGQLHAAGVYHRNLKPHVLMVDLQGRLRITNLLLAKIGEHSDLQAEELTTMGESMGSLDYMPPEQAIDARKADARSDIYALGCTLFHLLLGRPPFPAKGPMQKVMAHKQTPPPSLTALRAETPAWLDRAFQKMLAKDPVDRYQSTDELIAALGPSSSGSWWKRILAKFGRK